VGLERVGRQVGHHEVQVGAVLHEIEDAREARVGRERAEDLALQSNERSCVTPVGVHDGAGVSLLHHARPAELEIDGAVHRPAGGAAEYAGEEISTPHEERGLGQGLADPGGEEWVDGPFRCDEGEAPQIGDELAAGGAHGHGQLAVSPLEGEGAESAVSIMDDGSRPEGAVGGHPGASEVGGGAIQAGGQADGVVVVGRVDRDDLADLGEAAPALVELDERPRRSDDLEGRRALEEHRQSAPQDVRRRDDSGRNVQLPALLGHLVGVIPDDQPGASL